MNIPCKVCSHPTSELFALRNSVKTQAVSRTLQEASRVPLVVMNVQYCEFCDFYQIDTVDYAHYHDEDYYLTTEISETQRIYQQWFVEYISQFIASPVAEIGTGDGYLGKLLSTRFDYTGYEPAKKSYEECRRKNLHVINGYFTRSDNTYETIIGRQVLEHIEDLPRFLKNVHDSLTKSGVAIFEVPNIDKARRVNRLVDFCPEHVNYFTSSSFALVFSVNGFEVLDIRKTYNDEYLLVVATRRSQFHQVASTIDFSSMVFWGAGSRGISLCHLLGAKPLYFVDSDSNKFGKYIPSTTIEIKPPADLYNDTNCTAVVITSFFYFEEVLRTLRANGFKRAIYQINERNELVLCEH